MSVEQTGRKRKASQELPRSSDSIDNPPPQDAGETNTQAVAEPDTFESLLERISKLESELRGKIYSHIFRIRRDSVIMLEPLGIIEYVKLTQQTREELLRRPDTRAVFLREGTILRRDVIADYLGQNWVHFEDDFWMTLAGIIRANPVPHISGTNTIFGVLHSFWLEAVSLVRLVSINLARTDRHNDILYVLQRMPLLFGVLLKGIDYNTITDGEDRETNK
ncbi:hypothetical protein CSOJ01_03942 [Colletotrichum sojae]|uniref:Uncharacterized protein n=1 Tax=Colletotrichum sojae TaxID=2175907 RepID=A0A8H6JK54_9PEZI|nr:hypothetical protein CSOJ01_03942 [Colletotrichum sojae]